MPASAGPAVAVAEPVVVELPVVVDPIEEHFLEIREPLSGEVITAIEVLPPTNKRAGDGREQYLLKRRELLGTHTNLVEIDLLRGWQPMPYAGAARDNHYRILIRRGAEGRRAYLYAFSVRDPIPSFSLPLQEDDEEPVIDLGSLLREVYREARYDLRVDYRRPPVPALSAEDMAWAQDLLGSRAR